MSTSAVLPRMASRRFVTRPRLRPPIRKGGRYRLQASDRCCIDTEDPRYIGLRFASGEPLERFLSLMAVELGRTAKLARRAPLTFSRQILAQPAACSLAICLRWFHEPDQFCFSRDLCRNRSNQLPDRVAFSRSQSVIGIRAWPEIMSS